MRKYPDSDAFHLAPNAGITSDRGVEQMAMDHGQGIGDFGIGHKASTAMTKDWSNKTYSMTDKDYSMDYLGEKNMIMSKDAARVKKQFVKPGDAV
jgi:hypothetical protein